MNDDESKTGLYRFNVVPSTGGTSSETFERAPTLLQLRYLYSLQHDSDIWRTQKEYPYLHIDGEAWEKYVQAQDDRITLLSSGFLLQNIGNLDARRRLLDNLFGGGTYAGFSPSGNHFPEGPVNLNAYTYHGFNSPLLVSELAFLAESSWLIVIEKDDLFQYTVAELRSDGNHSHPFSKDLPLQEVVELGNKYRESFFQNHGPLSDAELSSLTDLLGNIFSANQNVHREAKIYHLRRKKNQPRYEYHAPALTAFGRLVHEEDGRPAIEHNLALLHYKKAIREFNQAKASEIAGQPDETAMHGAYCIIALATFIEAIANKVYFVANRKQIGINDARPPIDRLIEEAERIVRARRSGNRHFKRLKQSSDEYKACNQVRQLRNRFVHAVESACPIDAESNMSELLASVTVENCRRLFHLVRIAISTVLEQVPEVRNTVQLAGNIRWFGEDEVP